MLQRFWRVIREEFPSFLSPLYWYGQYRRLRIHRYCIGYSGRRHWTFWRYLLAKLRARKILILGVYFGRDIAYLLEQSRQTGQPIDLTGVDKFENRFCDDWPEEVRNQTWEQAGFGPAPSLAAAQENLKRLGENTDRVRLVCSRAEDFLAQTEEKFDFIYIDTAHDYQSTVELIDLAKRRLAPGGRLGGDDFSDQGTWGVKTAVRECLPNYELFRGSQIWTAQPGLP